jgi:type VI secretion system protein ImpE
MSNLPFFSKDLPLADSLKLAQDTVRANPTNSKARAFLFQLHATLGNWDKAIAQLQAAAQFDPAAVPMAQVYREAIHCEIFREEVFLGKRTPNFLGKPLEWAGHLVEALPMYASGKYDLAASLREQAFEAAETISGTLNETEFDWIVDADSRIGPNFELYLKGQYYWVPQQYVRSIRIEAPVDLRDLIWCPVSLTLENDGEHVALMPVRYPAKLGTMLDRHRLGQVTDWSEHPSETWLGTGQRMFATNETEYSLLDIRSLKFGSVESPRTTS